MREGEGRRRKEHARTRVTRLPENVLKAVPLPANTRPGDDHSPGQGWTATVGLSRHFGRSIPWPSHPSAWGVSRIGGRRSLGRRPELKPRAAIRLAAED